MAIVKSKLLQQLKKSYPNFSNKDLDRLVSIVLNEIKRALRRGDGVELRNFGTFRAKIQKASIQRLSQRPHDGALLYEARGFYTFEKIQQDLKNI